MNKTQFDLSKFSIGWQKFLEKEFSEDYFKELIAFVATERLSGSVYPEQDKVFFSLEACPLEEVKVVIVGQDPYHGVGQAHGLAFSVEEGQRLPPSLRNIYKELADEKGLNAKEFLQRSGNLENWARQGVLLLNTTLTVAAGKPMSHANRGWEIFTGHIFQLLAELDRPLVFVLWGNHAQKSFFKWVQKVSNRDHLVLMSAHPSPLSVAKFWNTKPFSKINNHLISHHIAPINFS